MTLRLYDTGARRVRVFNPLQAGTVSIYLCGATVQAPPHIGHVRSAVAFDVLCRWLRAGGLDVVFCRNITDIDDKIINAAAAEGVPWWRVAARNQRLFDDAYVKLGCLAPTVEPRATGHVPEMIVLIRQLIERGHAYADGGDVYFSVRSFSEYGSLSGQDPASMQQGETDVDNKRDPLDFALWKHARPGEPTWETPWGQGRPGWHLECSAMARKYLGPSFDIHAGGIDLLFPHHENEQAQSRAAGDDFANFWLHNGLVTLRGEKMSKSLGNTLSVRHLLQQVRPVELRYYLVAPHYRSSVDFTEEALAEAAAAYRRIEGFVVRATELVDHPEEPGAVPAEFAAALDDDLAVPQALAVLHTSVRDGNAALAAADKPAVARRLAQVHAMLSVLGLDDAGLGGVPDGHDRSYEVIDALVSIALQQRAAARERRDYPTADAIRDQLAAAGISVEDTPAGVRWQLRES